MDGTWFVSQLEQVALQDGNFRHFETMEEVRHDIEPRAHEKPGEAPETPPDEPQPTPVEDPPAEPIEVPYVAEEAGQTKRGSVMQSFESKKPEGARKERRGFASMSPEKQREIASKGGRAAHEKGTAHEWTSEEARSAGRKGGQISRGGRGRLSEPFTADVDPVDDRSNQ
jgi:uncharacterized protein